MWLKKEKDQFFLEYYTKYEKYVHGNQEICTFLL